MPHPAPERLPPGVRFIDHTADVGLDLDAPDLPALFVRAALGAGALVGGAPEAEAATVDTAALELEETDVALLLAAWLRELLFLRQVRDRAFLRADFSHLTGTRLSASIDLAGVTGQAVREIKGVTYHGLEVVRDAGRWRARVIFDV